MIQETPNPDPDSPDIWPPGYRAARQQQARQLRDQAEKGGLQFRVRLTGDEALHVLDAVASGDFLDPAEFVRVAVREYIELHAHPDLVRELLERQLRRRLDDPRPSRPADDVFRELKASLEARKRDRHPPAVWLRKPSAS